MQSDFICRNDNSESVKMSFKVETLASYDRASYSVRKKLLNGNNGNS